MTRYLLTAAMAALFAGGADARPHLLGRLRGSPGQTRQPGPVAQAVRAGVYAVAQPVGSAVGAARAGLMDGHAASMAGAGRLFHSGRFVPGASYEGVGFSTVSGDDAVRHACYWGQREPVSIDVRRGAGGYYAIVQYK